MGFTDVSRRALAAAALACVAVLPAAAQAQAGAQPQARPDEPPALPDGLPSPGAAPPPQNAAMSEGDLAMHAVRLNPGEHIVLDGTLANPAWQRAPVFDRFVEKDPEFGAKPLYETRVQILYDESALYVGVTAFDDQPGQIRAPLVRHDAVIRTQDFVVVYMDAIGKRQSAQFFRVGASGSIGDGMHTAADDNEDFSPDFDFDAASARNDHGYTSVFRIPFASLRFSSDARAGWRIMVARRLPRDQFYMWTSVPVPLDAPAFISAMQPLQGITLPDKHSFLTLRPSITAKHASTTEPGVATHAADGFQGSLDAKWRPLPELVVDGTLKPDFSQVELDVPQLSGNTSFALDLAEKRPFFFEASDLLRSPTDAIYTRSFTAPRWGLRSTWRGAALAGTAFAIDDKGGGLTLLPYAYGTGTAVQPGSRSLVARVDADVDDDGKFEVGGIAASRQYEDGRGENGVVGPDVAWQLAGWRLRGQWLHSRTTAQPDQDGSLARGAQTLGDSTVLTAYRQGERLQVDFYAAQISPGFRNDTGFVNQVGVRELDAHQGIVFRQLGPLNEFWFNLFETRTTDRRSGDVVQAYVTPGISLGAASNTSWSLQCRGHSQLRVAAGGPLLAEHYWKSELTTTPATWIPLLDFTVSLGRMADYLADTVRPGGQVNLAVQTRPFGPIELNPSLWAAWLRRDGRLTYRETASQLLGVWHIDARQNLRLIVQRSTYDRKAESNVSADRESGLTTSLTYALRRSMGTVLYVGATRSHSGIGAQNIARGTEAFVKLQVDVDEVRSAFGS